ncbi:MAG: hypothetical protein IT260_08105 [Saprospiraceae bacterium]|nr:hypothetical protein [Saprospiraceae bacterium]
MKYTGLFLVCLFLFATACNKDAGALDSPGKSGSITRFTVHNGYMYALNPNEVLTYSLQNPDQPQLVHRLATDYGLETIIVYDNTIFLGSNTALYILDISQPAAPSILSKSNREEWFSGGCDPVVVKGQYAYSTIKIIQNICGNVAAQSALIVYDVSNKNAPVNVGTYPLSIPNGLGYLDNYLFVCDQGSNRLEVFDISDPTQLQQRNDLALDITEPQDLIVDGQKMIVSTQTNFQIYDLRALPLIKKIGSIEK